ncbi:hypothetical protein GCM10023174_03640 [Chelativorans composti]
MVPQAGGGTPPLFDMPAEERGRLEQPINSVKLRTAPAIRFSGGQAKDPPPLGSRSALVFQRLAGLQHMVDAGAGFRRAD